MDINEFIKPEYFIIVPVLYIIGKFLKNSETVKNNYIPLILCGISILIALLYILAVSDISDFKSVMRIIFTSVTQGFLCAGAAVLTYQIKKQHEKQDDDDIML